MCVEEICVARASGVTSSGVKDRLDAGAAAVESEFGLEAIWSWARGESLYAEDVCVARASGVTPSGVEDRFDVGVAVGEREISPKAIWL